MHANPNDPKMVQVSVRLYAWLIRTYPPAFRHEYTGLMRQVFRDSCLRAAQRGSLAGLWARTLADYFVSILEQYANGGFAMSASKWIKISGWLMASSGLLLMLALFASGRPTYHPNNAAAWPVDRFLNQAANPSIVLALLFLWMGILGLQARFGKPSGSLGQAGLIAGLVGGAAAMVGAFGLSAVDGSPWWETFSIGLMTVFGGLFLFGLACLRQKLFSRWNLAPLLTGAPWLLLLTSLIVYHQVTGRDVNISDTVSAIVMLITAAGLAMIGYRLQAESAPTQAAAGV